MKDYKVLPAIASSILEGSEGEIDEIRQALFARHAIQSNQAVWWPSRPSVKDLCSLCRVTFPEEDRVRAQSLDHNEQELVLAAPVIAAEIVCSGAKLNSDAMGDIQRLRNFDPEFFDSAQKALALRRLCRKSQKQSSNQH